MTQIGAFTRRRDGYFGQLHTLRLKVDIAIVAVGSRDGENAPDYRVHAEGEDGPQVGVGWKRASDKAGEFISLHFDDPTLARPIHANLFQNGDDKSSWSLHWSRPRNRAEKG